MASSSTNSSTNQTDKSNQSSESSDQSKEILSTTSKDVEQTINETKVTTTKRHRIEDRNELSPHLIHKQSIAPLAAPCISLTSASKRSPTREKRSLVNPARPFEEVLVGQPNTDGSSGPITKPGDNNSSTIKKPS